MAASDEGDVDFLVYGYMNRGTYEGRWEWLFYHYDEDSHTVQEKFFVPVSEGYDQLESDITTLAYLGEDGMTYLLLNGKVTGIDLNSNESVTVAYGLSQGSFAVSADGSRTKDVTVVQEDSQVYEIIQKIEDTDGFKELKEAVPAVADAFEKVGKGEMDMNGFADVLKTLAEEETDETLKAAIEEVIEKLDGKDFVTGFIQFKVLDSVKAVKNADGKYEVEFSVPSITDDMENIQLVCYNEETKEWTIVDPINVDKEKKTIKVALDDLCYFTIVADAKEDTAE